MPNTFNPQHAGLIIGIEKTSKGLKAQGCLAVVGLVVGVILLVGGLATQGDARKAGVSGGPPLSGLTTAGLIVFIGSLAWIIYVRVATWWRHG